jgi:hypothetical protein
MKRPPAEVVRAARLAEAARLRALAARMEARAAALRADAAAMAMLADAPASAPWGMAMCEVPVRVDPQRMMHGALTDPRAAAGARKAQGAETARQVAEAWPEAEAAARARRLPGAPITRGLVIAEVAAATGIGERVVRRYAPKIGRTVDLAKVRART